MARFANSVNFTPASSGTVDFVVSAAVQGFMTPALAGMPTGVYKYRAESTDLSQWEVGEGTYTSGTTTLTRTTVLYNSAGTGTAAGQSGAGTKISFTVAPNVGIVQTVEDTLGIDQANTFSVAQKAQARTNISVPLRGHLAGLTLSAAGSTGTFGVAAGEAADSTVSDLLALASAYTKTTSNWAVGSGNGGVVSGSLAGNTWYHVWLIKRPDTGVVDAICDLASNATPTLPTNYTLYRRIGSMRTDGSNQWKKFVQIGDEFLWDAPANDVFAFTGSTAIQTSAVNVPRGIKVKAKLNWQALGASDSRAYIFSPDQNSAGALANTVQTINAGANMAADVDGQLEVFTNTSAQIKYATISTTVTLYISTQGWIDRRGRDD